MNNIKFKHVMIRCAMILLQPSCSSSLRSSKLKSVLQNNCHSEPIAHHKCHMVREKPIALLDFFKSLTADLESLFLD